MIEVTAHDLDTGDSDTVRLSTSVPHPRNYVVTCGPGCAVVGEQRYANGTTVITIKPTPDIDGGAA